MASMQGPISMRFRCEHVGEFHLAGFAEDRDSGGARLLIDDHGCPVGDVVWDLYRRALSAPSRADPDRVGQQRAAVRRARRRGRACSQADGRPHCPDGPRDAMLALSLEGPPMPASADVRRSDPVRRCADPGSDPRGIRPGACQPVQRLSQQRHRRPDQCGVGTLSDGAEASLGRRLQPGCAPIRGFGAAALAGAVTNMAKASHSSLRGIGQGRCGQLPRRRGRDRIGANPRLSRRRCGAFVARGIQRGAARRMAGALH